MPWLRILLYCFTSYAKSGEATAVHYSYSDCELRTALPSLSRVAQITHPVQAIGRPPDSCLTPVLLFSRYHSNQHWQLKEAVDEATDDLKRLRRLVGLNAPSGSDVSEGKPLATAPAAAAASQPLQLFAPATSPMTAGDSAYSSPCETERCVRYPSVFCFGCSCCR